MVGAELQSASNELTAMAANPSVPIDEVKAQKEKVADLQTRFDLIKSDHDSKAEAEKARLRRDNIAKARDDGARLTAAKAAFYRAAILGSSISDEAAGLLGAQNAAMIALPAGEGTGGEFLLPSELETTLVHEPWTTNPLRPHIRISNVGGLEVPKIAFTIDDDSFIGDAATAKEIAATGDSVAFGRNKFKVYVAVSDTVIHGTDTNLVQTIESALRSGLAAKEKKVTFASGAGIVAAEKHMSFYETGKISEVEGEDLYEAITNAIADLHEDFRENASVVMRYADYVTVLKTLSNHSRDLFGAPPERVIGKPVVFCDAAVQPIVGDLGYLRLNYDGSLVYDTDKDVKKGEYLFVVTAWFDQHRLLNSAFRRAKVVPEEG